MAMGALAAAMTAWIGERDLRRRLNWKRQRVKRVIQNGARSGSKLEPLKRKERDLQGRNENENEKGDSDTNKAVMRVRKKMNEKRKKNN